MAMDPKQERVLRDGTASEADQPRRTDRQAVRARAENPPIDEKPRPRRRTAAVADVRMNLPSGTPVEQFERASGARRVAELGRSRSDETAEPEPPPSGATEPAKGQNGGSLVDRGEARRALTARREHSKGDGNFPEPEPRPELLDEREADRSPRDLPKSRDDRSAPKGNAPAGQSDRNPDLEARDDYEPLRPRRTRPTPEGESSARRRSVPAGGGKKRALPTRSRAAKNQKTKTRGAGAGSRGGRTKAGSGRSPQTRATTARGSTKPRTKRAVRGGGPRGGAGASRRGKR
jgi:hypothetical protein